MNEIFGGGFSSRLFNNVRAAKGLAYSVGGGVGTSFDHPGMTRVQMQTKSGTTVAGIDALYEEIEKMHAAAPDSDEMKRAKDQILNSFIFRFDTPGKVLREKMTYEFYHYPLDFLEKYRGEIDKVTPAQVQAVAKKYLQKDKLAVLVVGNDSGVRQAAEQPGAGNEGGYYDSATAQGTDGADGNAGTGRARAGIAGVNW